MNNNNSRTRYRRILRDEQRFFNSSETNEIIPTPELILDEAKKLDFSKQDSSEVEEFHVRYEDLFGQKTPNNFLHVLAKRSAPGEAEDAQGWPEERLRSFLKWFLKKYSQFLTIKTESGVDSTDYPLHTAFSKRNYVFIEEVLAHPDVKVLRQVLRQKTTRNQTYIHLAIASKSPVVKLVAQKCKEFRIIEAWKGYGEKKLTPLHVAVREVHEFCGIVETIVISNSDYSMECDGENIVSQVEGVLQSGLESASTTDSQIIETVPIYGKWIKENLSSGGESQVKPKALEVVKLLISFCDTILSDKGVVAFETENKATEEPPEELTPYQMRQIELKDAWENLIIFLGQNNITVSEKDRDGAFRQVIIEDPVADAIRSYCLHNFNRDRIAKCLYQPGHERDLDFNLSGLPDPTISKSLLKSLSNNLRFETILLYVALPKLTLGNSEEMNGENGEKSTFPAKRGTITDLRVVFDWLRKKCDEVIEEALKGFQVENWDWKKEDLCTDVIAASSNQIKSISFYSSGNNAVLMGWASSEGLQIERSSRSLLNFYQLQKVRLFIQQGQESIQRREDNIEAFERKVGSIMVQKNGKQKPIEVEHRLDDGKVSYAAHFGTVNIITHQEISWISELERFAVFLASEKSIRARNAPIKIAIIDDGIDASLDIFKKKIAAGRSFCPLSTYYVPSGHHGTMMGDLICRICASVQLYVARLDESTNRNDMSRQITVQSAAEAVEWAVACKVDIISMSWTIEEQTPRQNLDLYDLEAAISAAESNQILMFCAASDQGGNATVNCYPGMWNKCIKIGAATAVGDKYGFSITQKSGSSIATALASGLAGLLLCCDRLTCTSAEEQLQGQEQMRDAFRRLTGTDKSDRTFVEAHKTVAKPRPMEWTPEANEALLRIMEEIKGDTGAEAETGVEAETGAGVPTGDVIETIGDKVLIETKGIAAVILNADTAETATRVEAEAGIHLREPTFGAQTTQVTAISRQWERGRFYQEVVSINERKEQLCNTGFTY
ncbi:hypothetical protein MKX08_007742 [Trichoderma sp. CBMAI-0020]|nr:hypothetical protein MKX08_007742 [Trichoderma sp. CBMAI-0020]